MRLMQLSCLETDPQIIRDGEERTHTMLRCHRVIRGPARTRSTTMSSRTTMSTTMSMSTTSTNELRPVHTHLLPRTRCREHSNTRFDHVNFCDKLASNQLLLANPKTRKNRKIENGRAPHDVLVTNRSALACSTCLTTSSPRRETKLSSGGAVSETSSPSNNTTFWTVFAGKKGRTQAQNARQIQGTGKITSRETRSGKFAVRVEEAWGQIL